MAIGGYDELIKAGANALGYPDPYGSPALGQPGSSVEIAQDEGDQRITVVLKGRSMPYQGVSWEVGQRSKIRWYPGNPVATQQVLGPEEFPTIMGGKWKNRYIGKTIVVNGDETAVKVVQDAVRLFQSMCRAAKAVRVQWHGEVRTGIIKHFRATYDRPQDAEWELEFEWQSRDDEVAPRGAGGGIADVGTSNDLLSFLNRVEDIAALAPLAADIAVSNVAQVISTINRVRDIVSDVVQVLRIAETTVNLPATLLGAAKAAVTSLELEIGELVRRITGPRSSAVDNKSATELHGDSSDPLYTTQGAGLSSSSDTQLLKFDIWRRSVALSCSGLLFATQQQVSALVRRSQPQTAQMVTLKAEQTLYSVSQQYYGTPDYANFLASVNRLTSIRIPAGTQLRIPPRPFGAAGNVDLVHAPKGSCDARCNC